MWREGPYEGPSYICTTFFVAYSNQSKLKTRFGKKKKKEEKKAKLRNLKDNTAHCLKRMDCV